MRRLSIGLISDWSKVEPFTTLVVAMMKSMGTVGNDKAFRTTTAALGERGVRTLLAEMTIRGYLQVRHTTNIEHNNCLSHACPWNHKPTMVGEQASDQRHANVTHQLRPTSTHAHPESPLAQGRATERGHRQMNPASPLSTPLQQCARSWAHNPRLCTRYRLARSHSRCPE